MLNVLGFTLRVLPFLGKHWLLIVLIGALTGQHVLFSRSVSMITEQNRVLKDELASARGTIQKLNDAVVTLKPGETKIITVDRPVYLPGPMQTVETKVPVVVTRTDTRIETQIKDPIVLPPKEIERIIDRSPQSLIFNLEATRDIQKGEKFRVVATLIAPGVYQPILDIGSPVTGTVTTVIPIDRIPQVHEPPRLSVMAYSGWSTVDQIVAGLRVHYTVSQTWGVEAQAERRFGPSVWEYRLLATARW